MRVFKYEAAPDTFTVDMPEGAQILSVGEQSGHFQMWALVDPGATIERRRFHIAGTGHPLPKHIGVFINTFQMHGGSLVFHAFEFPQS